jgi:peptide/nickel transport system substrate-binding protein
MRSKAARGLQPLPGPWRAASLAVLVLSLTATGVALAAPAGELHVGVPRVPASLDPAEATAPSQILAMRLLYEGLVTFGERGDIEPALAATWTVSRDGLVWTFRLRPDIQLHDGAPLGVDEVVAALAERISAEEPFASAPTWVRPFRGASRLVREIRRGAGASVQVVLGQPYAPLLALLAHPALAVSGRGPGPTGRSSSHPSGSCWRPRRAGGASPRRVPG